MDIKSTLFALSQAVSLGNVSEASDKARKILSEYMPTEKCDNLTVTGTLKGESDYTLMLDAHIDEVGFVVTDVDDKGFLTVKNCGGIDLRTLPARSVTIHGKQRLEGVFCSTPPHLSGGQIEYNDISALKIDTTLGEKARELVSVGDFVSFSQSPCELLGSRVTGKAFDNRVGVTVLLCLAERLSGKKLPFNVAFVLSDMEELGLRGAKTAAYGVNPDEAIVLDVTFGDAPDVSPTDSCKLGGGAMIGVSPILSKEITEKLKAIAEEKGIDYDLEVMGGSTGTNSDAVSLTRKGVKTGLISIPLRNMHTSVEVVDICDIEAAVSLLEEYILKGGAAV